MLAGSELAEVHWHVPKVVIAGTLVALGTSLPELVIAVTSIMRGHKEILVGNVIGADVLNVLFVVGASATAAPLPILEQRRPRSPRSPSTSTCRRCCWCWWPFGCSSTGLGRPGVFADGTVSRCC